MTASPSWRPIPKQVGTNRMDVVTNGRKLSQELMDGVKANGSILLTYEYVKPGEEKPIRKIGYAVAVPGFDMYRRHRRLSRRSRRQDEADRVAARACHSRHRA